MHEPTPAPPRRPRGRGRLIGLVVTLALIAGASTWTMANRQYIVDQVAVWGFHATPVISSYVDRSTMSGRGEFLFLASKPTIASKRSFNGVCGNSEAGAGILGCYLPSDRTIVLFDVTNEQLDGIEEVVASHEMLHAGWDRLGADEKARLTTLLEAEAATLSTDTAFVERMKVYADLEPGERTNELHSILGTEVERLSPALEEYYARYFTDRSALLALHVASDAVFVALEARAKALTDELESLRTSIEADYARYNDGFDALNRDVDRFNAAADSGGFPSPSQFQRARSALVDRQAALDALFASIGERSDAFDAKAAELKSLNAQTVELNTSLNIVPRTGESPG